MSSWWLLSPTTSFVGVSSAGSRRPKTGIKAARARCNVRWMLNSRWVTRSSLQTWWKRFHIYLYTIIYIYMYVYIYICICICICICIYIYTIIYNDISSFTLPLSAIASKFHLDEVNSPRFSLGIAGDPSAGRRYGVGHRLRVGHWVLLTLDGGYEKRPTCAFFCLHFWSTSIGNDDHSIFRGFATW